LALNTLTHPPNHNVLFSLFRYVLNFKGLNYKMHTVCYVNNASQFNDLYHICNAVSCITNTLMTRLLDYTANKQ
jgi:hypothetical protein